MIFYWGSSPINLQTSEKIGVCFKDRTIDEGFTLLKIIDRYELERLTQGYISKIKTSYKAYFQTTPAEIHEQIAASVRDDIYRGVLSPGQWIREVELAKRFGTSRGPVKKALHLLHKDDGLVEMLPRRGTRVALFTRQDIMNLYDVRAVLFGLLARLAAEARDRSFIAVMQEGLDLLEKMVVQDDLNAIQFSDVRAMALIPMFHAAQNALATKFLSKLEQQVMANKLFVLDTQRCAQIVEMLQDLVQALQKKSASRAERLARTMVWYGRDAVLQQIIGVADAESDHIR
jgi:DNA-binding GntR family transcriptional regulator